MQWEAPWGAARAAGGLLGVVGGEAWRGSRGGFEHDGPVTAALVDLCRAYVGQSGGDRPTTAIARHEGVPGVAWLLPVVFLRLDKEARQRDVRRLTMAAGISRDAVPACLAYVELAARLFQGPSPGLAVRVAAPTEPRPETLPPLSGIGPVDGLVVGTWALDQPGDLATTLACLVEWDEQPVAPWVVAAVAGLLGLRDGCAAIPAKWHRCLPAMHREVCQELGHSLAQTPLPA